MKTKKTICIINPNTSSEMTNGIAKVAKKIISSNFDITSTSPEFGPESIEGYYDEVFCIPGIISEIKKNPYSDAYIIACFDDTGLDACRSFTDKPVLGIGECSYHAANLLGGNFSVITTLSRSIPALKGNLKKYGIYDNCNLVTSVEIPVLDLEKNPKITETKLDNKIHEILSNTNSEIIVLGCAGMSDFAKNMQDKYKIPVIEGISVSIKFAESFVELGLKTSKKLGYAKPRTKKYSGIFKPFQP